MILAAPLFALATLIPFTDPGTTYQQNAYIATDGVNRAAVWEEAGTVRANLFGDGGAGVLISDRNAHSPAIAALPGEFFIVWIEADSLTSGTLLGRRYTRDLQPFEPPFVIARHASTLGTPVLRAGDIGWLIAYISGIDSSHTTMNAVRMGFDGNIVDREPLVLDGAGDPDVHDAPPSDVPPRRHRVVAKPSPVLQIAPGVSGYTLAWDGNEFLSVAQRIAPLVIRLAIDENGVVNSSELARFDNLAINEFGLYDAIGDQTLAVQVKGRLFWLVP